MQDDKQEFGPGGCPGWSHELNSRCANGSVGNGVVWCSEHRQKVDEFYKLMQTRIMQPSEVDAQAQAHGLQKPHNPEGD